MDDNSLLVIILAFILGCMCSGMMKQMCGGRLVEGALLPSFSICQKNSQCASGHCRGNMGGFANGHCK